MLVDKRDAGIQVCSSPFRTSKVISLWWQMIEASDHFALAACDVLKKQQLIEASMITG